ncbi:DUF1330 domain-containing protein [Chondrinema litorale]|uniref:DUF1330 domain-containing protein n=1 Tax=Chondrinema litorale TaxID=2994555 RepID=UPI002543D0C8|nr:DUF1330 domain-containing protein [Chondrinema litorale]UZR97321.1 DUF1330 domain-containing protein [Chondrinema litorale]
MIYITQLIFIQEGKEELFLEFESHAIPLMEKHGGKLIYRLRPKQEDFISGEEEKPYEIHFVSFESEEQLNQFMHDDARLNFIHLKNESVKTMLLVKGKKM